ncbi:MAG: J domain-containing protein [Chloroflexota bacterium]
MGRLVVSPQLPGFDLYAELEVSPVASVETIDAAYRSLAKRNHPDTAGDGPAQMERIKRINVAHDWLSDPALRSLYDASLDAAPGKRPRPAQPRPAATPRPPRPAAPISFGPRTRDVERLLAEAERLDPPTLETLGRAGRFGGPGTPWKVDYDAYGRAYRSLLQARERRPAETEAARVAAVKAIRAAGRITEQPALDRVAGFAGLAAEALAVGDLLPAQDLERLLRSWRVLTASQADRRPASTATPGPGAAPGSASAIRVIALVALAVAIVLVVGSVVVVAAILLAIGAVIAFWLGRGRAARRR